jgi:Ca2+/H+ antiporter, TMEM165/GDT1 family
MESLLVSTGVVALAEIGDKTQLLAFILAARFKKPLPIIAGILLATSSTMVWPARWAPGSRRRSAPRCCAGCWGLVHRHGDLDADPDKIEEEETQVAQRSACSAPR